MEPGKLSHKITIQKPDPASARDSAGQRITAWLPVAVNIWARVEPLSGREAFLAAQRQENTTHRITLWYSAQLAAVDISHRVLFGYLTEFDPPPVGTRIFVLDGPPINTDEANIELILRCSEGLRTEN